MSTLSHRGKKRFVGIIALLLVGHVHAGDSLDGFLKQVENTHPLVQRYKLAQQAAEQKRVQVTLLSETHVFGETQILSETKPGNFSLFLGEETFTYGGQIGLSGIWNTGTQWRTGLQLTATSLPAANPSLVSEKTYSEGRLFAEITQPLWRDAWNSALIRRQTELMTASDIAFESMTFGITQTLVAAETAYWQYLVLVQLRHVAEEAVSRAKEVLLWTETRRANALVQDNDVAQAKASLALRELELEQAKADAQRAQRSVHYWVSGPVSGTLPDDTTLMAKRPPKKTATRHDLMAQMARAELARLEVEKAIEAGKPSLSMKGSIALNQRENSVANVLMSSLSTRYPAIGMSLQLSLPTDAVAHQRYVEAQHSVWSSEEAETKALSQNIEMGWDTTMTTLSQAKIRLSKAKNLEKTQYTKWQLESERHKKGRSTLSQVLNFEQDYANARTTVLRTKLDLLTAFAQAKLFGEN